MARPDFRLPPRGCLTDATFLPQRRNALKYHGNTKKPLPDSETADEPFLPAGLQKRHIHMAEDLYNYKYILSRLISGGQTGADRAALDVALELGIPAGGWCPAGRRSALGTIPARYPMTETATRAYPHRTRLNIRDSDATLVITRGMPTGGTRLTIELAERMKRPCLVIDISRQRISAAQVAILEWLHAINPKVLNIAGPRASESPGLGRSVRTILRAVLAPPAPDGHPVPWPPKRPRTPNIPGL